MLCRDGTLHFEPDTSGRIRVTGAEATLVRAGRRCPITAAPLVVLPGDAVEHEGVRLELVLETRRPQVVAPGSSHAAAIALAGLLGMTSPAWADAPASTRPTPMAKRAKKPVPPPAPAAGSVQGKVGRAEIELSISGRTVLMDPNTVRERAVTTDDKGQFSFAGVPPGTHVLRVRVGEKEKAADTRVQVRAGQTASASLQLRRNVTVLRVRAIHAGLGSSPQPHSSY